MVVLVAVVGCDVVTYISRRISAGLARATLGRHFSCAVRPALECSSGGSVVMRDGSRLKKRVDVALAITDAAPNFDDGQGVPPSGMPNRERLFADVKQIRRLAARQKWIGYGHRIGSNVGFESTLMPSYGRPIAAD